MTTILIKNKNYLKEYICGLYPGQNFIKRNASAILKQALFNLGIEERDLRDRKMIKSVCSELDEIILAVEFEGLSTYSQVKMVEGEHPKNIMKYLLHEIQWDKSSLSWDFFKNVFFKQDPRFLTELRKEFQDLFFQLQNKLVQENHDDLIVEMYLGNLLSLYAFADPQPQDNLIFSEKVNGRWQLVEHKVELIDITPDWIGEPMVAIGLLPKASKAPAKLLFRGTPLPGAKAWHWAELADFTPGCSLGQLIYSFGKDNLSCWIQKAVKKSKKKIKVYGQSLGGALAYQTALHHPDLVEINGYVPPGLYSKTKKTMHGNVFCHADDLIYLLGEHPTAATLIKVLTEKKRNPYIAHVRSYGSEKTILLKVNSHRENRRPIRKAVSLLHQCYSVPFFTLKLTQLGFLFAAKKIKDKIKS